MSSFFARASSWLTDAATWSARVTDLSTGETLWEHNPACVLKTASVGKIFLLTEVARRFEDSTLDPSEIIAATAEDQVADSGILYLLRQQDHRIDDLCLLIGAVSDNMATNMLLRRLGLKDVQTATCDLGFIESGLRDRVRLNRPQDDPLTLSVGNAAELCDFVTRLDAGTVHGGAVSDRVRRWLGVNTDLSMVAQSFGLDPLAHTETDHGFEVWNKTGTISDARIDIGCVRYRVPGRTVAYAVAANWPWGEDHRDHVLQSMRQVGCEIRRYLENTDQD
ncbi:MULTISPECIES: serine hydrolase [unclassified Mycolicibacterium]|uniref:serine hydrolase n=1 Tax=unclassified Mycolicibacterium TaxID=2636767 RepID=UPI0012DE4E11|nr:MULTISPECIES: serine hydrolase [unclassified Mycolicibacterium]MUL84189.1 serine hydrolase [Mycolicibacterium sp. CBMA 329]MUL89745.1 serine hydrolase [Mycolicibacterium sp. CBMA 331]MUL99920.1 serine hydrolase [Mycolicibacterium sp. CBMA 334]MUM27073.1 serine hydrolase [Mycolicibacterium sp. CBMA 295]MUM39260.1 serine hydrolase [Mycolicibacterium sp. CBMA 247]